MRLQMTMKRPVVFPDLDPEKVLSQRKTEGVAEALQAYGEALLDCNEPCMEASESASEVIKILRRHHADIGIRRLEGDRYALTCGKLVLWLEGHRDASVHLVFTPGSSGIDVSDFGSCDVARFIRVVFDSYEKVTSAIMHS